MIKVLFVCLGNICRSPSAEAVFNALIEKNGLGSELQCDSAGTAAYHAGEPADFRMKQFAKKRGYRLTSISRPFNTKVDFDRFDYIIGMDNQNVRDLKALARNETDRNKIFLMTDFCFSDKYDSVPDPYYGDDADFGLVIDILEDACAGLFRKLRQS
ncbi:MAG: low molecular weight protein-tyrosine-phosphatase [Bacteroidota bacterium]|nr:phosphotyrosine protein phosphatase [Odoribacter sp.]MDP3642925.1 low molecular weight protein-tyrosine-phosphatase [Bacteroidota bacterium]